MGGDLRQAGGGVGDFPILLSPLDRGRLQLKNRTLFPAHQTLMSRDGVVSEQMLRYYAERAKGGVGAVVVEGVAVHPTTIKFPHYLRGYESGIVPSYDRLADALHEHGCKAIIQLAHSGSRMATLDSRLPLWAPSAVRAAISPEIPHALTIDDIEELLDGYAATATNVLESRCDGIELHSAHEYLPGEFLSPINNRRTDRYGGSLDNRMRFLLEVAERVRDTVGPDFPVGVRMNGSDRRPGGLELEDYVGIATRLAATGWIDYISISGATSANNELIVPPMDVEEGLNVENAAAIRAAVEVPVFVAGRIKRPEHAEQVLAAGQADAIAIARAFIADPAWVRKAGEDPASIRPCTGCNQACFGNLFNTRTISCQVNPAVGLEQSLGIGTETEAEAPRRVAVLGGGPAGLEAALAAAERGHEVVLFEAAERLGGQVHMAAAVAARRELLELVDYQVGRLEKLGVKVELGRKMSARGLGEEGFDAVVLATGSTPRAPGFAVDGIDVLSAQSAIADTRDWRSLLVVVIDEVNHFPAYVPAELLAEAGAEVRLLTARLSAGTLLDIATVATLHRRLARLGVEFVPHTAAVAVEPGGVRVRDTLTDEERLEAADAVVAAVGNDAEDAGIAELVASGLDFVAVGDCLAPRTMVEAVREGRLAGRAL